MLALPYEPPDGPNRGLTNEPPRMAEVPVSIDEGVDERPVSGAQGDPSTMYVNPPENVVQFPGRPVRPDLSRYTSFTPPDEAAKRAADMAQGNGRNILPMNPAANGPTSMSDYEGGTDATGTTPAVSRPVNPAAASRARFVPDPNKSRSENLRDEIAFYTDKKFHEHRGVKNTLEAGGLSFLKAFAQTDPRMKLSDRLIAAAGGGAAGLIGGTVNPNIGPQMLNDRKLAQLYDQYGQSSQMDEMDAKIAKQRQDAAKVAAETTGVGLDNVNKSVADYLKVAMADDNIDEMEAGTLRKMTGLPYSANDWRKVITTDEQGVPFIRREGSATSQVDPSRPINPSLVPKTRAIPGQGTFTVPDKEAFPVAGQVAVGNANREQSASQYQQTQTTNETNRIFEDSKDYQKAAEEHGRRVLKAKGDARSAQARLNSLNAELGPLQQSRAALVAQGYDTSEVDKQLVEVQGRVAAAEGDLAAANELVNEPAPKKMIRPKNPRSKGGKNDNVGTEDDYTKALKKLKGIK